MIYVVISIGRGGVGIGGVSHASPIPSPSVSVWSELAVFGELSSASGIPSPSVSTPVSQISPTPSPSASAWLGL